MPRTKATPLRSHLGLADEVKNEQWNSLRRVINDLIRTHMDLTPSAAARPSIQIAGVETVKTKIVDDARFREYFPLNMRIKDLEVLGSHIKKQTGRMQRANRNRQVAEDTDEEVPPRETEATTVRSRPYLKRTSAARRRLDASTHPISERQPAVPSSSATSFTDITMSSPPHPSPGCQGPSTHTTDDDSASESEEESPELNAPSPLRADQNPRLSSPPPFVVVRARTSSTTVLPAPQRTSQPIPISQLIPTSTPTLITPQSNSTSGRELESRPPPFVAVRARISVVTTGTPALQRPFQPVPTSQPTATSQSIATSRREPMTNASTPQVPIEEADDLFTFLTKSCQPPIPELHCHLVTYGIDMGYLRAISEWPEERIHNLICGVRQTLTSRYDTKCEIYESGRVKKMSSVAEVEECLNALRDGRLLAGIKPIQWDIFEHHLWKLGKKGT